MSLFVSLDGFEPTRQTLHKYANVMGVVPRVHAAFHPQWWHISLRVTERGLKTAVMPLPDGGTFWLEMDLRHHHILLQTSYGGTEAFSMTAGLTGTEMGDRVLTAVTNLNLSGSYAREKFESNEPRQYDPVQAENFFTVLTNVQRIFSDHRATLAGKMGPIQVWPHGFDLAFEWFGTRVETHEEHGEVKEMPSQINLGFYPGGDPYFYSNPWPFESEQLLDKPLPEGAAWHTEGWQGSTLAYRELVNDQKAESRLRAYAQAVFELAGPTLLD
jgi:hypothetical protein